MAWVPIARRAFCWRETHPARQTAPPNMNKILTQLHDDHRNFIRILHAMAHQLHLLHDGWPVDFQALKAAVTYYKRYAIPFHHTKENSIFNLLKDRDPNRLRELSALISAHASYDLQLDRITAAIVSLENREPGAAAQFREELAAFIDFEKNHIREEETHLIPEVLAWLTPEDWVWINEPYKSGADPIFGTAAVAPFDRLLGMVLASDKPNAGGPKAGLHG